MKTIHIVNGDTTKDLLQEAALTEPIFVWREMLCQGPVSPEIGSDAFWQMRAEFIAKFTGEHSTMYYYSEAVEEFNRMQEAVESTDRVVLWFEHDLFCQINYVACLTFIAPHISGKQVDVVLPEMAEGAPLKNLSDYSPDTVLDLLTKKEELPEEAFLQGRVFWHLWCQKNIDDMLRLSSEETHLFPWLNVAVAMYNAWLIPNDKGFTSLYEYISARKHFQQMSKNEVVKECLTNKAFKWLGFGDLQYANIFDAV